VAHAAAFYMKFVLIMRPPFSPRSAARRCGLLLILEYAGFCTPACASAPGDQLQAPARFFAPATDCIGCNMPKLTEFFRRVMTLEGAYN